MINGSTISLINNNKTRALTIENYYASMCVDIGRRSKYMNIEYTCFITTLFLSDNQGTDYTYIHVVSTSIQLRLIAKKSFCNKYLLHYFMTPGVKFYIVRIKDKDLKG